MDNFDEELPIKFYLPSSETLKSLIINKFIGRRILADNEMYPAAIGYRLINTKMLMNFLMKLFGLENTDLVITCSSEKILVFVSGPYRMFEITAEELYLTSTGLYTNQKWFT